MNTAFVSDSSLSDASAVAAVMNGDRNRYRELVERYADQVFAVAWCRLGAVILRKKPHRRRS